MKIDFTTDERHTMAFFRCGWLATSSELAALRIRELIATSDMDRILSKQLEAIANELAAEPSLSIQRAEARLIADRMKVPSSVQASERDNSDELRPII